MNLFKTERPLEEITQRLPKQVANYHQPLIGDGAALLQILTKLQIQGNINVSDPNYKIVKLFRDIQNNFDEFIKGLDIIQKDYAECPFSKTAINVHPKDINEAKQSAQSYYIWIKNIYKNMCREMHDTTLMSVLYLFLKNANSKKTHKFVNTSDLWAISVLIQPVTFNCRPLKISLANLGENDFVYLDLPDTVDLSLLKMFKGLPCNALLCSSENSQLHREFPLGFYNVERFIVGYDELSVQYEVLISNYSPSESGNELSIASAFIRPR